jgi:hypothetical protein
MPVTVTQFTSLRADGTPAKPASVTYEHGRSIHIGNHNELIVSTANGGLAVAADTIAIWAEGVWDHAEVTTDEVQPGLRR